MYSSLNTFNLPTRSASLPFYSKGEFPGQDRSSATLRSHTYNTSQHRVEPNANGMLPRDIGVRFGERLREMRKARNMTQLRMSVDFGIDRSFISDVECGKKSISLGLLEVIALGLEVKLSDLLSGL
jgi:ribosome-binding protein aMBF1 (putative translation factor)